MESSTLQLTQSLISYLSFTPLVFVGNFGHNFCWVKMFTKLEPVLGNRNNVITLLPQLTDQAETMKLSGFCPLNVCSASPSTHLHHTQYLFTYIGLFTTRSPSGNCFLSAAFQPVYSLFWAGSLLDLPCVVACTPVCTSVCTQLFLSC